ncbi:carboxymuconolactone decarboxylase family protein [Solibacillus sp. FSL R5-0691]|uniref:carboxymuconolactone decarboxylase family protein n=1 Tax=Solibacillus sp. FSL R5-0691 TaxID=2921653 RepID=UPI0030CC3E4B
MTIIKNNTIGDTPFQQLLGFNIKVQEHWASLGDLLEKDGFLTATLKEQVRRVLAQENGCQYCKAKGKPDPILYDEKTAICTSYAEAFLKTKGHTPLNITLVLKEYLSDEEISELLAFISFTTASQYFGALMQLKASN